MIVNNCVFNNCVAYSNTSAIGMTLSPDASEPTMPEVMGAIYLLLIDYGFRPKEPTHYYSYRWDMIIEIIGNSAIVIEYDSKLAETIVVRFRTNETHHHGSSDPFNYWTKTVELANPNLGNYLYKVIKTWQATQIYKQICASRLPANESPQH